MSDDNQVPRLTDLEQMRVSKRITKLMQVIGPLGPELALRIIVSLLVFLASGMNYRTRRNVVSMLTDELNVPVQFELPPDVLKNWRPKGSTDPSEIN